MFVVNNIEVLYDRVILVLKGVSLTVPCGTAAPTGRTRRRWSEIPRASVPLR